MATSLRQYRSWIGLFFVTLIAGIPLWTAMIWYVFFWLPQAPFAPPGDPNIGVGIAYLVAMLNIPFLLLAWTGWAVWNYWFHAPLSRQRNSV